MLALEGVSAVPINWCSSRHNDGGTEWDKADSCGWVSNEKTIGHYRANDPDHRESSFPVTKSAASNPNTLAEKLIRSLENRLKTKNGSQLHFSSIIRTYATLFQEEVNL